MTSRDSFYVTGGTVPRDAPCYVTRQADDALHQGLSAGEFCYVLTSRQMGKSSLMVRTAQRLREDGATVLVLDLTALGQNLSPEQWYLGLLLRVAAQLDREDELEDYWEQHRHLGPLDRLMRAIRELLLKDEGGRMKDESEPWSPGASRAVGSEIHPSSLIPHPSKWVVFIDEIDTVRSLPFSTDEFFAAIRECYNRRVEDPELHRLTFCLLGVAAPSDLIRDPRLTPFNIGRRIELTDFTPAEAAPLAVGISLGTAGAPLRSPELGRRLLERVLYWTAGHPFLTQRLCRAVSEEAAVKTAADVDRLCTELFLAPQARERDDNLLFVRERILRSEDPAAVLERYALVRRREGLLGMTLAPVRDDPADPALTVLRLSGIVGTRDGHLSIRSRIYARAFDAAWIAGQMPQAELRRQQAAYRRGLVRAASLATLVLSSMGLLTAWALDSANRASLHSQRREQEALRARQYLQVANMNLAQVEWNAGRLWRVRELLDECRPGPGESDLRGFEWHLLHRRGHFDLPGVRNPSIYAAGRLAFSRDGKTLWVDDLHGTALYWNLATGDQLPSSPIQPSLDARNQQRDPAERFHVTGELVHEEELQATPASLRQRLAARAEVVLRDHQTGRAVRRLPGSMAPWAFSADGKTLATQLFGRKGLALWIVATGRRLDLLPGQAPFAFSPDGSRLAARSPAHGETVQLFDLTTSREPRVLAAGEAVDFALQSPGGTLLLQDDTLRSARTLEVVGRLPGGMTGIAFLAEDRLAVTRDASPGHLVIVDPRSLRETGRARMIPGQRSESADIAGGALSADERRLAVGLGGESPHVVVLEAASLTEVGRFPMRGPVDTSGSFALSPDGRSLVLPEANAASLWSVDSGRRQLTLGNAGPPFAFAPGGSLLATGSPGHYGSASLWDLSTGRRLFRLLGHRYSLHAATFSPDGKRLLTGDGGEYAVKAWDTATGRETWTLPGRTQRTDVPSYSLFFSPDGSRLYSGNQENTLKAWEIR